MQSRMRWYAVGLAMLVTAGAQMRPPRPRFDSVSRDRLCVTEGKIEETADHKLAVNVPKMRAYVLQQTPPGIEARFTYLGGTAKKSALGSGAMRQQFGLKLRAQDACNLVYVMWRFEPESEIVVSVKRNPGQHTSAQCGNRGYKNIKARDTLPVPTPQPDRVLNIWARMDGEELKVIMNNLVVWEGSVGPVDFDGPVGIRSDNIRLKMQLWSATPLESANQPALGCKAGKGAD